MKVKGVLQPDESNTAFDRILNLTSIVGMAMILFAMLSLCAHVFMRYVYNHPLNWSIDVASIFLLYITILAAAWLQKSEGHVAVDFIFTFLRRKAQIKLHIFNSIICAIAFMIMIIFGIKETITVYRMDLYADMPIEPPKWLLLIVIPIGSFLLVIQFLRRIRSLIKKLKTPDEETGEQPA